MSSRRYGVDAGKFPGFFLVGAPKCGTTSIGRYLNAHPDIFVAPGEPHFFGSDIEYNPRPLSRNEYVEIFRKSGAARKGEVSTWYLYSRRAAAEIAEVRPDARIIIQIRNPVEMVHSLHSHLYHKTGREDIDSLEEALDAEPERRSGHRIPRRARFPEHLFYSDVARYTNQIRRYVDRFGWERVHVIVFDDLAEDPSTVYRHLLEFLRVDTTFEPEFTVHNAASRRRSVLLHEFLYSRPLVAIGRRFLPHFVRRLLRRGRTRIKERNLEIHDRAGLSKRIRERLKNEYRDDVEALSVLLDRDLTPWIQ